SMARRSSAKRSCRPTVSRFFARSSTSTRSSGSNPTWSSCRTTRNFTTSSGSSRDSEPALLLGRRHAEELLPDTSAYARRLVHHLRGQLVHRPLLEERRRDVPDPPMQGGETRVRPRAGELGLVRRPDRAEAVERLVDAVPDRTREARLEHHERGDRRAAD